MTFLLSGIVLWSLFQLRPLKLETNAGSRRIYEFARCAFRSSVQNAGTGSSRKKDISTLSELSCFPGNLSRSDCIVGLAELRNRTGLKQ